MLPDLHIEPAGPVLATGDGTVARQIGALPPPGSAGEHLGVLLQRLAARKKRRGLT